MTVKVIFECDGCDAKIDGVRPIRETFHSLDGKGWGFGRWCRDTIEDVAPYGWISFDPATKCTYCPKCWSSIIKAVEYMSIRHDGEG